MQVKDVTAGYDRKADGSPMVTVLRDVNVTIERGSVVDVIGESGCGKSTLARGIAGLLPASEGEVLLAYCWIGDLTAPMWWWEKGTDGRWRRTFWRRDPGKSWRAVAQEPLSDLERRAASP